MTKGNGNAEGEDGEQTKLRLGIVVLVGDVLIILVMRTIMYVQILISAR